MSDIANPERGEVSLEVGGQPYVFKITLRAIVELERLIKPRRYQDVLGGLRAGDLGDLMLTLWAALRTKHPKLASKDLDNAVLNIADFVEAAGGLDGLNKQLNALLQLNERPPELTPSNGDGEADPQPAVGATVAPFPGDGLSSTGSAAA